MKLRSSLVLSPDAPSRRVSVVKRAAKMDVLLSDNKSHFILMFAKAQKRIQNRNIDMLQNGWGAFVRNSKEVKRYEENRRKSLIRLESQQLLKMQTKTRTLAQVKTLVDWMLNSKVFPKDLPSETLNHMCTHMGSIEMEEGEVLFLQEDPGDKFYIILEGSIRLAIQESPEQVLKMRLERDEYPNHYLKVEWLVNSNIGKVLKDLPAGIAFGELSMMNNYQNRTTSAFCCSSKAQLCVVEKDLYERTLRNYHANKSDHATINKQLLKYPLFSKWNLDMIEDLSNKMTIHVFKRSQKVAEKGNPVKMLTVVVQGEVVIVGGRGTNAILSRIGPGGLIGDIELFNGIKKHSLDSVANSSECICYQVSKEDFINSIKFSTDTINRMKEHASDKMKFHSERWRNERKKDKKKRRTMQARDQGKMIVSPQRTTSILEKIKLDRTLEKKEKELVQSSEPVIERTLPEVVQFFHRDASVGGSLKCDLSAFSNNTSRNARHFIPQDTRMRTAASGIGSHVSLAQGGKSSYKTSLKDIMISEQKKSIERVSLKKYRPGGRAILAPIPGLSTK